MKLYGLLLISLFVSSCSTPKKEKDTPVAVIENQFILAKGSHPEITLKALKFVPIFGLDSSENYRGVQNGYCVGSNGGLFHLRRIISFSQGHPKKFICMSSLNSLHFRDIQSFPGTSKSELALSIGSPGYIKRFTSNNKWVTSYQDPNPNIFMDGMDFWDNGSGLVYGDPLDGYHFILKTTDYGLNFKRMPKDILPNVLKDEAGFAASGTGVVCIGKGIAYIGYGGEKARVFKSMDYGKTWQTFDTPIKHGAAGKGIYCMAFKDSLNGIVAGGNWENAEGDSTVAFTNDGGKSWTLGKYSSGYRSGICHVKDDVYLSVGTAGTDISFDNGATWQNIDGRPFNAIDANPYGNEAFAVGNFGSAIRILF